MAKPKLSPADRIREHAAAVVLQIRDGNWAVALGAIEGYRNKLQLALFVVELIDLLTPERGTDDSELLAALGRHLAARVAG